LPIKKLIVSNSSINIFKSCKLRFKYKYVDKIPMPTISSKFLSFGTSVHKALAEYNKMPVGAQDSEVLEIFLQNNWSKDGYKNSIEEQQYFDKGRNFLKQYHLNKLDVGTVLITEEMIFNNINEG
jgi:hypothetical protein